MAQKTSKPAAANGDENRLYPNIERFVETTDPAAAAKLFEATKGKLGELSKGAKAANAKKVLTAIDRVDALIQELLKVRADLEAEGKKARK